MQRTREPSIYERFEKHAHRRFEEAAAKWLAEFQAKTNVVQLTPSKR